MTLLADGDRLTRAEFERRWNRDPGRKHAELLDGVVSLGLDGRFAPACRRSDLQCLCGAYCAGTPGASAGAHSSLRVNDNNELQPTVVLYRPRGDGGRPIDDPDGILSVPPDWAADVVTERDLGRAAARHRIHESFGTREYLRWDVEHGRLDWFVSRDGRFDQLPPDRDRLLKSQSFPGLWLDAAALVRRDLAAVLAALSCGLASPEHAAFAARLAACRAAPPALS